MGKERVIFSNRFDRPTLEQIEEEMKKETKKHRLLLAAYQGGGGAECMRGCTYLVAQLPVATAVR